MQRKRRQPTPLFKTPPPFNPISGKYETLSQDGVSPYCAMMQVAAEDTYDNYVICRGFDTRILKFVDYEEGNPDKPGISVAKPFGSRGNRTYKIGEIYPAFLPTQGTPTYVPPSPVDVLWRLGQNPGAVASTGNGGQPEDLADEISLLYDHNSKIVSWIIINAETPVRYWGKIDADIPPGGSGTFTIWNPLTNVATDLTLTAYNISPSTVTADDDLIGVSKDGFTGAWIIDTQFCQPEE